jgi:5'(3')-deoxyribonucleotidase
MNILLDMDGVLVDFVDGAARLFGTTRAELEARWPRGEYDMAKVLGVSVGEFWGRIGEEPDFWFKLNETEEAQELYRICLEHGDVFFCTTPNLDPQCAAQKIKWLNNFLGKHCRNYILTPNKSLVNGFLVDDYIKNKPSFLWPQPWNGADKADCCRNARLKKFKAAIFGRHHDMVLECDAHSPV